MENVTIHGGYQTGKPPSIPKPDHPIDPMIVSAKTGVAVRYPASNGMGVRVVHPVNPRAPGKNLALVLFYLPPHTGYPLHEHEPEEAYVILEGEGRMMFSNFDRDVKKGDFVYLQPWCKHGIENTGSDTLVALIASMPPNP
jgi:mannose-6-phosphate isomerase-like protein (cupin superfamily)